MYPVPEVSASRRFFRFVVAILLIALLMSLFPWIRNLLTRIVSFPELRHQINLSVSSEQDLPSANLIVTNSGLGAANNVLIHISAQQAHIVRYQIDSQELYQIKTANLENGVFDIWLDRIASEAEVHIVLTGTGLVTDTIFLSATSDEGTSKERETPSLSHQAGTYSSSVIVLFSRAGNIILESPQVQEIRDWASTKSVLGSREFQTVTLAGLIVILLMAILLPTEYSVLGISLVTGFIVWLFSDVWIKTRWLVVTATLIILGIINALLAKQGEADIAWHVLISALIVVVGGIAVYWFWFADSPLRFILALATASATYFLLGLKTGK